MRKILGGIGVAVLGLCLSTPLARADGGVFPPHDSYIYETKQRAVIVHEDNRETLILSIIFQGDSKDFAWVIPTPSQPEVDKGQKQLFNALEELTSHKESYGVATPGLGSKGVEEEAVTVHEVKQVDIYDIAVLSATDENALFNWLNDNGYTYPASGKYILDSYIEGEWFFTAVRVNNEAASELTTSALNEGTATPLKLTFQSDKIVYPLRISAIVSEEPEATSYFPDSIGVLLYVLADHKKRAPGFDIEWANWLERQAIQDLATDDQGEPWYTPQANKMYLTALFYDYTISEMTEDVYIINASDNTSVTPGEGPKPTPLNWGLGFVLALVIFLVSPITWLFIIAAIVRGLSRSDTARSVSAVLQFVALIITIIGGLLVAFIFSMPLANCPLSAGITAAGMVTLAIIVVLILQRRHERVQLEKK